MITKFYDMYSGGYPKNPPYEIIYIDLPQEEAVELFMEKFGQHPEEVACTCCGEEAYR